MMCDYKDNTFFIYMQIFGKLFSENLQIPNIFCIFAP